MRGLVQRQKDVLEVVRSDGTRSDICSGKNTELYICVEVISEGPHHRIVAKRSSIGWWKDSAKSNAQRTKRLRVSVRTFPSIERFTSGY